MTQYVDDFPIPDPSSEGAKEVISLVRAIVLNNRPCNHDTMSSLNTAISELFC